MTITTKIFALSPFDYYEKCRTKTWEIHRGARNPQGRNQIGKVNTERTKDYTCNGVSIGKKNFDLANTHSLKIFNPKNEDSSLVRQEASVSFHTKIFRERFIALNADKSSIWVVASGIAIMGATCLLTDYCKMMVI